MNEARYNEEDFNGYLNDLIESESLESKEAGIAKLALDKGFNALSPKQKYVFNTTIENNSIESCDSCVSPIPWCEMIEATDNGGLCGWCAHREEKMKNE